MKKLPENIQEYYRNLEDKTLKDIVKRINKSCKIAETTSEARIQSLLNLGYNLTDIKKELSKDLDITAHKLGSLVNKAGLKSYAEDAKFYAAGGKKLKENPAVFKMIDTMSKSAVEDLNNLTGTLGLAGQPLEKWYKNTLNQAVIDVTSGTYSTTEVMRRVINEVGDKGLEYISYSSGRNFSVEAAVKMNLNSTVNRLSAEISLKNAEEMNQDLMEITAHAGARPTHQEWQGQIVSLSGQDGYLTLNDIGYGSAEGFMGVNCRHNWYPYFPGKSKRFWDDETLEEFKYKEKTYDEHSAYQKLRNLDRAARKHNRKAKLYDAVKDDEAALTERVKEQRAKQEQRKFKKVINNNKTCYNIYEDIESADKVHRPQTIKYWKEWTNEEKYALYDYTCNSDPFNIPLRNEESIQFDNINYLKSALDKTSLDHDITVYRGVGSNGVKGLLNIESREFFLTNKEILDSKDSLVGSYVVDNAFVSTGVNKSGGFTRKDYIYEIRCPKGTKGAYIEPFSNFGMSGDKLNWDGKSFTDMLSNEGENEFLIQAGTPMKVIDILEEQSKIKLILEVVLK